MGLNGDGSIHELLNRSTEQAADTRQRSEEHRPFFDHIQCFGT
ncbi:hypothetical protein SynA1560_01245 [Synechococcus sp. A15-60]|nr:hypothetical protein SynA1560_01245 [Synechococcus sp. A15-60]